MKKTIKFTVSMPEEVFKELESMRRKTGRTRSQFIRDSIRAWKAEFVQPSRVKEEAEEYRKENTEDIVDAFSAVNRSPILVENELPSAVVVF